jgi:hypothetical protein
MKLKVHWHRPLILREGRRDENLVYACDDLDSIPRKPGIYVFARRFGAAVIPLYVGQAVNLHGRVKKQLNNVQLMMGVQNMEKGRRILLIGEFIPTSGQQAESALDVLERAYIENSLTGGYELLNKQGTRTPVHSLLSQGKKGFHSPFPRRMNIKKR